MDIDANVGWPPCFGAHWDIGSSWVLSWDQACIDSGAAGPRGSVWYIDEATWFGNADIVGAPNAYVQSQDNPFELGPYVAVRVGDLNLERAAKVRWYRVSIRGALGASEIITHTLSLLPPNGGAPSEDQGIQLSIANAVRDAWQVFLASTAGPSAVSSKMTSALVYQDVALQLLERTVARSSAWGPNGKRVSDANNVSQIGPTILAGAWTGMHEGHGTDPALPYEVAMALTLRTRGLQTGGASHGRRNRGRLFLGGFTTSAMASGGTGLFDAAYAHDVAASFGTNIVAALSANAGVEVCVVSQAGLISHSVNKVEVGVVPDSQRRRRNALEESRAVEWSIP